MIPKTIVHHDYELSVLFAVPVTLAKVREIVPSDDWHTASPRSPTDRVRACRLDEYSDYGFLINPAIEGMEIGPSKPTYGFLLADALIDPAAFVQIFETLPPGWNFGGLIAIDPASGLGVNTNCDLGETMQWHHILEFLTEQGRAKVTFTLTDTGVSLVRREGDIFMQQFAWDVPSEWGAQGQLHYPNHRFIREDSFVGQLKSVLIEYDTLCRESERWSSRVAERLRGSA
ncbi:MAG: hypothetical protein GXY44_01385 [Phycisphaerales bacterium]|nr:hypothetical protein [Phycisphaerales bacterium]